MRVDHEKKDVLLMSLTGLESQDIEEEVVVQGSGLSRGDKRRNARLARLRELVPAGNAILGIDLADQKQVLVLADHDSRVLARRRVLDQLAAQQGMALVCVQPLLVGRARESEDYTRDKSDDNDAVLIARLVAQLRCYAPERADETWARLRHLGRVGID